MHRRRFEMVEQLFEMCDVTHDDLGDEGKLPGDTVARENFASLSRYLDETRVGTVGARENKCRNRIAELGS